MQGARLKKESLYIKIDGKNISELARLDIQELSRWMTGLEDRLNDKQRVIASEVLKEIRKRIGFLLDVGLEYLNLDRPLRTLSGGEAQRIRLATRSERNWWAYCTSLTNPAVACMPGITIKLIKALQDLRDWATRW